MSIISKLKSALLGPAKTGDYKQNRDLAFFQQPRDLPLFTYATVQQMLIDPTIRLGLRMRAAPLCQAEFAYRTIGKDGKATWTPGIKAKRPDVAEFVLSQLMRIWNGELHKLTLAEVWGWSACEVVYRVVDGRIEVDKFLHRHARDSFALMQRGEIKGVQFRGLTGGHANLTFPKAVWHAHDPECESPYGNTVLRGAYSPWADKWLSGGALDVRRLFCHKDAYGGVDMTYPGGTTTNPDGQDIPNRDIAREITEQLKSGGVTTRPSTRDENGHQEWELTRATVPTSPAHIMEYPKDLDNEMLRGLEIPDDVISSDAGGGAWQGKQVPMMAFYTAGDISLNGLVTTIVKQVIEPLVTLNWGSEQDFEVETKPLAEQALEQIKASEGNDAEGSQPTQTMMDRLDNPRQARPSPNGNGNQNGNGQPPRLSRFALDDVDQLVGAGVLDAAAIVRAGRKIMQPKRKPRKQLPKPEPLGASGIAAMLSLTSDETKLLTSMESGSILQMAAVHAPKGGATVQGKKYKGGQFIPGEVLAKASAEEKQKLGIKDDASSGKSVGFPDAKHDRSIPDKFPSDSERKKKLRELSTSRMTFMQQLAMDNYAAESESLNSPLRDGQPLSPAKKNLFDSITAAIDASDDLPKETTVYRGLDVANIEQFKKKFADSLGKNVNLKGLTSTSLDPQVATTFTRGEGIILEIKPKKGLYRNGHGAYPEEDEIILKHNAKYQVVAVQDKAEIVPGRTRTVIQLQEV